MPAHIMIVEDNPTNLELMSYLLRSFGHSLVTTNDGELVLELVSQEKPDLIICDIQLPTTDGYEVARQLKQDPASRPIPLIAVTAYAMVGDQQKLLSAGFNGYISKPIDPQEFCHQVDGFLPADRRAILPLPARTSTPVERPAVKPTHGSILVVDDSALNLDFMKTLLEASGYAVLMASTCVEGLALAREKRPDLIISDVHLRGSSGYDLVRTLKADPELSSTPCILLSCTEGDPAARSLAMAAGGALFILRPVDARELLEEIRGFVRKRN